MSKLAKHIEMKGGKLTPLSALAALLVGMSSAWAYDANLAWVYETGNRPVDVVSFQSGALAGGLEARGVSATGSFALANLEARGRSSETSNMVKVDARKPRGLSIKIR